MKKMNEEYAEGVLIPRIALWFGCWLLVWSKNISVWWIQWHVSVSVTHVRRYVRKKVMVHKSYEETRGKLMKKMMRMMMEVVKKIFIGRFNLRNVFKWIFWSKTTTTDIFVVLECTDHFYFIWNLELPAREYRHSVFFNNMNKPI